MPQISEAENEDKDYSGGPKAKKARVNQGHARRGTKVPGDYENNHEGEAGYASVQKDSEPGNRQGDEAPSVNQFSPQNSDGRGAGAPAAEQPPAEAQNKTPTEAADQGGL
jgi:hypothetical protein